MSRVGERGVTDDLYEPDLPHRAWGIASERPPVVVAERERDR